MHVPEATGNNRPVLDPDASMELFQDTDPPEPPQAKARAQTAAPVSKWTIAEDLDTEQSAIPVSKWVAQEVGLMHLSKEVRKQEACGKTFCLFPVYANDNSVFDMESHCYHRGICSSCSQCFLGWSVQSGPDFSPSNVEVFTGWDCRLTISHSGPMLPILLLTDVFTAVYRQPCKQ